MMPTFFLLVPRVQDHFTRQQLSISFCTEGYGAGHDLRFVTCLLQLLRPSSHCGTKALSAVRETPILTSWKSIIISLKPPFRKHPHKSYPICVSSTQCVNMLPGDSYLQLSISPLSSQQVQKN